MTLLAITLTGIDEQTDFSKLWRLSKTYPLVEWGVLYSNKPDNPRYPRPGIFFKEYIEFIQRWSINSSVHFCGSSVNEILEEKFKYPGLPFCFSRMQLNFNQKTKPVDLGLLRSFIERASVDITSKQKTKIITQHNVDNEIVTNRIHFPNHQVLIDSSCGQGKVISNFDYITSKSACGYAGGLSLDNLETLFPIIKESANSNPFWIDMESSLRTDDLLDLKKVEEVLKLVYKLNGFIM